MAITADGNPNPLTLWNETFDGDGSGGAAPLDAWLWNQDSGHNPNVTISTAQKVSGTSAMAVVGVNAESHDIRLDHEDVTDDNGEDICKGQITVSANIRVKATRIGLFCRGRSTVNQYLTSNTGWRLWIDTGRYLKMDGNVEGSSKKPISVDAGAGNLTLDTWFKLTLTVSGPISNIRIRGMCMRRSDGAYLKSDGTFGAANVPYYAIDTTYDASGYHQLGLPGNVGIYMYSTYGTSYVDDFKVESLSRDYYFDPVDGDNTYDGTADDDHKVVTALRGPIKNLDIFLANFKAPGVPVTLNLAAGLHTHSTDATYISFGNHYEDGLTVVGNSATDTFLCGNNCTTNNISVTGGYGLTLSDLTVRPYNFVDPLDYGPGLGAEYGTFPFNIGILFGTLDMGDPIDVTDLHMTSAPDAFRVKSTSHTFAGVDLFKEIVIPAGQANWTAGTYKIWNIESGWACLSKSPAAINTTGGIATIQSRFSYAERVTTLEDLVFTPDNNRGGSSEYTDVGGAIDGFVTSMRLNILRCKGNFVASNLIQSPVTLHSASHDAGNYVTDAQLAAGEMAHVYFEDCEFYALKATAAVQIYTGFGYPDHHAPPAQTMHLEVNGGIYMGMTEGVGIAMAYDHVDGDGSAFYAGVGQAEIYDAIVYGDTDAIRLGYLSKNVSIHDCWLLNGSGEFGTNAVSQGYSTENVTVYADKIGTPGGGMLTVA